MNALSPNRIQPATGIMASCALNAAFGEVTLPKLKTPNKFTRTCAGNGGCARCRTPAQQQASRPASSGKQWAAYATWAGYITNRLFPEFLRTRHNNQKGLTL